MADNLEQIGRQDDARIDIELDHELRYWSEKFQVSRDELRSAVAQAGPLIRRVREDLQRRP
jgi:hypothetical protein